MDFALLILGRFASLPKPKESDWELVLPDEQREGAAEAETGEEDAAIRDRRHAQIREARERLEFKRRTQVMQRGLPRPLPKDPTLLEKLAKDSQGSMERAIALEAALLIAHDLAAFPSSTLKFHSTTEYQDASNSLESFDDDALGRAKSVLLAESGLESAHQLDFENAWEEIDKSRALDVPIYEGNGKDEQSAILATFEVSSLLESFIADHPRAFKNRSSIRRKKAMPLRRNSTYTSEDINSEARLFGARLVKLPKLSRKPRSTSIRYKQHSLWRKLPYLRDSTL